MGRPSTISRNDYKGTDNTDTYPYTFIINSESDLLVTRGTISDGTQTTFALNVDYTVTGATDAGGGNIILIAGDLSSDFTLTVRRSVPITQTTDIRNGGTRYPEIVEDTFDTRNDIDQEQQDQIDRSPKFAETTDVSVFDTTIPVPVADMVIKINSANTGIELASITDAGNISLPAGLAIMVQTAAGIFTARSIVSTGNIDITDGDGQSGDMTVDSTTIDTNIATNVTNIGTNATNISTNATDIAELLSNFPTWYQNGVCVDVSTATTVTLLAGATVLDSNGVELKTTSGDLTADITASGLNGLDQGSESASTHYALYLIWDPLAVQPDGLLLVDEADIGGIVLPDAAYTSIRRVNWVRNDSSSDFETGFQDGNWFRHYNENSLLTSHTSTNWANNATSAYTAPNSRTALMSAFTTVTGGGGGIHTSELYTNVAGSSGSTGGIKVLASQCGTEDFDRGESANTFEAPIDATSSRNVSLRTSGTDSVDDINVIGYYDKLAD